MSKTFFTADLHLGHKAIIWMQKRPFKDVNEMNETIITNYNSVVSPNDRVFFLGDLTHHLEKEEAVELIKKLKGKKTLILGNHDHIKFWEDNKIFQEVTMMKEISCYNKAVVLLHYPMLSWRHMNGGTIHLHGHQHNPKEYNEEMKAKRILRYDVGVEANNYYPVEFKQILEFFGEDVLNNPLREHHKKEKENEK